MKPVKWLRISDTRWKYDATMHKTVIATVRSHARQSFTEPCRTTTPTIRRKQLT